MFSFVASSFGLEPVFRLEPSVLWLCARAWTRAIVIQIKLDNLHHLRPYNCSKPCSPFAVFTTVPNRTHSLSKEKLFPRILSSRKFSGSPLLMSCQVCPPSVDLKTVFTSADLFLITLAASLSFSTREFNRNNTRRIAGTDTNNLFILFEFRVKHIEYIISGK